MHRDARGVDAFRVRCSTKRAVYRFAGGSRVPSTARAAIVALALASLACGSSGTRGASADASTTPLVPEAEFTDVPPLSDGGYAARVFYVFQPADEDAPHKPLFVLSMAPLIWP